MTHHRIGRKTWSMKYGLDHYYWHEFILQAYLNHRYDVIFLTGLPDVPKSLPHSSQDRLKDV